MQTQTTSTTPRRVQTQAAIELVFAGCIWGFGFVATVWALRSMGPLAMSGWRFFLAAVIGFAITLSSSRLRLHATREQFLLAATPGLLLSLMLTLQTWGLKYTTATKGGFITTLYVLMVPLLEKWILRKHLARFHFLYVFLGLIGVALICDLPADLWASTRAPDLSGRTGWNLGDLLTLLCAVVASFHIIWFGVIQKRLGSAFVFNNFQSLWACAIPLALSFVLEPSPHLNWADLSLPGFLSLLFASTLIAFALQVRAQKVLSPSLSSLLFLLESPFAALFAVLLLGETLKGTQWLGAGLILLATAISTADGSENQAG